MSNKAMNWATECGVKRAHKLIIMLLADAHNGHSGECFPSQATLMEKSGYGESTVQSCLKDLEEWGLITRETKRLGRGKGSRTNYVLHTHILDPQILEVQNTGNRPPESEDLDPQRSGGEYKDEPEREPELTGNSSCESDTFEDAWKLYNTAPLKARQTKKLAKQAWKVAIRKCPPNRLLEAIRGEIALQHEKRGRKEFCPSLPDMHRWMKQERWNDVASAQPGTEKTDWLDFCFRMLAENGDWPGAQYGYPTDPRTPKADYPAALYEKYSITKRKEAA